MTEMQAQGIHHITFVGSDREATIDFYQGLLGMPLVFEQPNLDVPEENHLYFDPGDGRLITFFADAPKPDAPQPGGYRQPAPPGLDRLARHLHPGRRPTECSRHLEHRPDRPRLHGLDLFPRSAGSCSSSPATSSSRRPAPRTPTCCARPTISASPRGAYNIPTSTWPTPSSCCRASRRRPEEEGRLGRDQVHSATKG